MARNLGLDVSECAGQFANAQLALTHQKRKNAAAGRIGESIETVLYSRFLIYAIRYMRVKKPCAPAGIAAHAIKPGALRTRREPQANAPFAAEACANHGQSPTIHAGDFQGPPFTATPALAPDEGLPPPPAMGVAGDCVRARPTRIVVVVRGYPEVDFKRGECTFCGACAAACKDGALPW